MRQRSDTIPNLYKPELNAQDHDGNLSQCTTFNLGVSKSYVRALVGVLCFSLCFEERKNSKNPLFEEKP